MAFWSRLRQSKLKYNLFSNEFKRCYTLNRGRTVADQHIASSSLLSSLINSNYVAQSSQVEFLCKVRSYAAPVQAAQKKEEKDTSGPRLNEQITASTVRLVNDEDHFITSRYDALARAKSLKLDLVEVDRHAKPPVCKIFDYHKEKYIQQTKEKERAKSKAKIKTGSCKEIRFAGKIKPKDLEMKANMAKRLMESGHRVKCTAIDPTDEVDLETLLSRFCALIEDIAVEESAAKVEKRQAYVVVRHIKFGPSKKGSGKKASKITTSSETSSDQQSEDNEDEAGSATEHAETEESSDEDAQTEKSKWAVSNRDDDIHAAFDFNKENRPTRTSRQEQPATINEPLAPPRPTVPNRYARDRRSVNPSRIPPDTNGRFSRNTTNPMPQVPVQGKHPQFSMNRPPQTRFNQQERVPVRDVSKQNPRFNQQERVPVRDVSKQNPNSPSKSYGIFSAQQVNTTSREKSAPAETNRYKRNPPTTDSRMNSNKTNESQSQFQRRY